MKFGFAALIIALILLNILSNPALSYGAPENYVAVSGFLNVRESVYIDGTLSYQYILMSSNDGESTQKRYHLELGSDEGGQRLSSKLESFIGSNVIVEGFLENGDSDMESAGRAENSDAELLVEEDILVSLIEPDAKANLGADGDKKIGSSVSGVSDTLVRALDQVVSPARYADVNSTPHSEQYYTSQFYTDEDYSLAAYWRDASYDKLRLAGKVTAWVDLPRGSDSYLEFGGREADLVAAIDSQVDFDGPDDEIQNALPQDVLGTAGNDDVDSIIGIYNGLIGQGIAGYGYLEPISLSTDEGDLFVYFTAITDTGAGSPEGVPSDYFVGLAAHEMGHNLGWYHTATPDCVFCDPWSIMSGGIYSDLGPSGPIAIHRESEGWIAQHDVFTITEDVADAGQATEVTLDILGRPTGANYLMVKVPFGSSGHYYSIEARKNVVNDHTPREQTGLVIYHFSPTGHPDTMEQRAFETIVDTTKTGDLANADVDVGQSFVDLKNKITITNVAKNKDTITVKVLRGAQPPTNGNSNCNDRLATIVGTSGPDNIDGTAGDDVISGLGGDDVINGLGGNDLICGGWGSDRVDGGDGDDLLFGNRGNDILLGDDGNDNLVGGVGDDKLEGGDGNDRLFGWSGKDQLFGGEGNDSLYGGDGDDYLLGGDGKDLLAGWLGEDTYSDRNEAAVSR
jgi:M6 family metalloprotease-like protein